MGRNLLTVYFNILRLSKETEMGSRASGDRWLKGTRTFFLRAGRPSTHTRLN